ncbi:hypothetical protein [Psychroserpens damuponensis]|uniref:hypothetical protein n=1 Tax=Psychroserpens damuponensis TaxID=943936 RepID=UPI00058E164C|nr:hypothetical protein [Psychroserpens damuponensis]
MKKTILVLTLLALFCYDSQAQSHLTKRELRDTDAWILSAGINATGSLGSRNPFKNVDDFQFRNPFVVGIQHKWSRLFSIEQDFSINGFTENTIIDGNPVPEDYTYFSTNTYLKYYFSDHLWDERWIDIYAGGGLGVFRIDEYNTSANVVLGGILWINPRIGVSFQGVGKFAFNHDDNLFANNHIQYMLQGVFRLD